MRCSGCAKTEIKPSKKIITKRLANVSLFLYSYIKHTSYIIMGKFNWWRRHKSRTKLSRKDIIKGKSLLLQQIEHGDFDPSEFAQQAKQELILAEKDKKALAAAWKAGPNSLLHRQDEIERKYIKRHNKLMEDFDREEYNYLFTLKERLLKEFGVDLWEESLIEVGEGDVRSLYQTYKTLADRITVIKKKKIRKDGKSKLGSKPKASKRSTLNSRVS